MYKIARALVRNYNEAIQANPLRWEILYLDTETKTLLPQGAKMKCKDFFNDLVARYQGVKLSIYGFDTSTVQLNQEGVYFRLSNVVDIDQLEQSIKALEVAEHPTQILRGITRAQGRTILFVPRYYFESTYRISLLSHIVRIANNGKVLSSWNDYKDATQEFEPSLFSETIFKYQWTLPESFQGYWIYINKNYNSKGKGTTYAALIHNNGMLSWAQSLE